ncbi:MAG: addiction module protein [Leptospirales bacterium]
MAVAIKELLDLNVSERIDLALKLWESIPDKSENIIISPQDQKELDKRYQEHLNNPEAGRSWVEIKTGSKSN